MKRLILLVILLFPLATLIYWVGWGLNHPHALSPPPAQAVDPTIKSNVPTLPAK
jgi:hypothetical protein